MADYSALRFNPFNVPLGTPIAEHYPPLGRRAQLASVPEHLFTQRGEKNTPTKNDLSLLTSFVILLVDRKSPFYDELDYRERTVLCMEALRIAPDSLVGSMILTAHWWFGIVLAAYLRTYAPDAFETWITIKINAWQLKADQRRPAENMNDDSRIKRMTMAGKLREIDADIAALEATLFRNDEVREAVTDIVTDSQAGYAEEFALNDF